MTMLVTQFDNVMGWARRLAADTNRAGLEDLIKLVLRPVQAAQMRAAVTRRPHLAPESLWWTRCMGALWEVPAPNGTWLSFVLKNCRQAVDESHTVLLSRDVVLPTLWSTSSIRSSLGSIGAGRQLGRFQQDLNHHVMLMLPLGIVWVGGESLNHAGHIVGRRSADTFGGAGCFVSCRSSSFQWGMLGVSCHGSPVRRADLCRIWVGLGDFAAATRSPKCP